MADLAPAVVEQPKPAPPQENVVLPALRGDLQISKQSFEGRTYYVVKDPISLQYFRLTAEDYELATLFNGQRPFGAIRDAWVGRHPHLRLDYTTEELNERVLKFANDLALLQFLSVQGQRIKARMDATKKAKKKGGLYAFTNQVFFFRKSLWDPDVRFAKMAKPLGWVWTKATFWISWAVIALGAALFIYHSDNLDEALANLFNWHNLALMWVTTIVMKSIHELGHGLTCKHFGGEVHEVGFMSMVFTPYFFVNVSDSWTMPDRRHRMLVSFAGIYVELVFAALATFMWVFVQPGWFKDFLFNIIIIASVSTLLFNANPLMRFDGYYIMIDAIETPNLQQKSRALVQSKITRWLFGSGGRSADLLQRMPLPKKRLWLFYSYAVLSWLYGYYVIYSLIVWMGPHLEPLGLEGLADWFAFLALTGWVVVPLWMYVKQLNMTREDLKPGGRWRRIAWVFGIPLAAFLGFCFVPVEKEVTRHSAVELAEPEIVHPDAPGFVAEVHVREGQMVKPGDLLGVLENRELKAQLEVQRQSVREYELRQQQALGIGKTDEMRVLDTMLASTRVTLMKLEEDVKKLELRAKTSGVILSRDMEQRVGLLLRPPNDAFCEIGSLNPMRMKVPLSEKEVRDVKTGNPVTLIADAYPGKKFTGVVAGEPLELEADNFPLGFSQQRGGDVPTFHDPQTGRERLLEHTYVVTVEVQNPDGHLRYGMTARAKIATGKRLYGKIVLQWFTDLISLDYRF